MITAQEIKQQVQQLQDTLSNALEEVKNLNQDADAATDKGLDAVKKSPYSTQIVTGIALGMLTIGWFAHSLLG